MGNCATGQTGRGGAAREDEYKARAATATNGTSQCDDAAPPAADPAAAAAAAAAAVVVDPATVQAVERWRRAVHDADDADGGGGGHKPLRLGHSTSASSSHYLRDRSFSADSNGVARASRGGIEAHRYFVEIARMHLAHDEAAVACAARRKK
jgi:hypothetical protein